MVLEYKKCILFLVDGARPDVLSEQLSRGNLPHFSRYFVEKGTHQTLITSFPSTTGPAYLPYLTGCHPGTCNIPGIRWFDKDHYAAKGWGLKSFRSYVGLETVLLNRDLNSQIQTVFEIFNKPISILNNVHRGLSGAQNKTKWSRIWYFYYAHQTDRWAFVDESMTSKLLAALDTDFDFAFVVYASVDEYSHRSSPFHPRTIQAYQELDSHIGKVIHQLKNQGKLEETLLGIVSDHGLSETKHHFDIGPYLEAQGIKTFFYTQIFKRHFKAASMVSGNGMVHLYFEGLQGWKGRCSFEHLSQMSPFIDELRCRPEISLMAIQGEDQAIHLLTDQGHGKYSVKDNMIRYEWDKNDPLNIFTASYDRFVNISTEESLMKTFDSLYPDIFMQLYYLFKSPRAGDMILSARPGYDFRERYENPLHKASHGALCPEHMKVPFLLNHPLAIDHPLRSMDVFPIILKLMGKEVPQGIDGISPL